MNANSKILVTGHNGLVGSAVVRRLRERGWDQIVTIPRAEVDLRDSAAVRWWFSCHQPEYVFHCAARVGGIAANAADPLGFFQDNLAIQNNVLTEAARYKVQKLLFLGSSCIYPRDCPQPIREEYLLTGALEKTNEAYALAKIAGVMQARWFREQQGKNFVSAFPCNVFGPNDSFNEETAHVVPGIMARMHAAKQRGQDTFYVWGAPNIRREVIFSEDLADALILVMQSYEDGSPINTGSGLEVTMHDLATHIATAVGFKGHIEFDGSRPSGTPRKLLDNSKLLALGFSAKRDFDGSLQETYRSFLQPDARR